MERPFDNKTWEAIEKGLAANEQRKNMDDGPGIELLKPSSPVTTSELVEILEIFGDKQDQKADEREAERDRKEAERFRRGRIGRIIGLCGSIGGIIAAIITCLIYFTQSSS